MEPVDGPNGEPRYMRETIVNRYDYDSGMYYSIRTTPVGELFDVIRDWRTGIKDQEVFAYFNAHRYLYEIFDEPIVNGQVLTLRQFVDGQWLGVAVYRFFNEMEVKPPKAKL